MSNIIQLHHTQANTEPAWYGPEDITIGADKNGERLEATIDQTDDGRLLLIVPPTTFTGRVGYTLTDDQAAQLASAIYEAMSATARQQFQDLIDPNEGA